MIISMTDDFSKSSPKSHAQIITENCRKVCEPPKETGISEHNIKVDLQ
jgi:hypothetical protein